MEIIADILICLAMSPDDAWRTLFDKESPMWTRILSGLALIGYVLFLVALIVLVGLIIS